jgi:hypothetical protein
VKKVLSTLNLTFSPGEKEQQLHDSGFTDGCPANPVAGFSKTRRTALPLLEERAGVRTDVKKQIPLASDEADLFSAHALTFIRQYPHSKAPAWL